MPKSYDTPAIRRKDIAHQVHPWTDFSTFKDTGSLVLADAEGAFVCDSDGNWYLDGIGGLWCVKPKRKSSPAATVTTAALTWQCR